MGESNATISELFRCRRRELSVTQADIAEQAGCKQSAVSMFEAGRVTALSTSTIRGWRESLMLIFPLSTCVVR